MAPASWATKESLKIKREAYNKLLMTTHWPCDDVGVFPVTLPSYAVKELHPITELPEVARGDDAKRLMGILPYPRPEQVEDIENEKRILAQRPKWNPRCIPSEIEKPVKLHRVLNLCGLAVVFVGITVAFWVLKF